MLRMWIVLVLLVLAGIFVIKLRGGGSSSISAPAAPSSAQPASPSVVDAALAPYRKGLERTRRPVLRIDLQDFPEDDARASKVGGSVWWPLGEPAPLSESGGAMVLLAQINFAELPASEAYPAQGLLQFFITPDEFYGANFDGEYTLAALSQQRNFRVVYWPDIRGSAQSLPAKTAEDFLTPHRPEKPRRMRFTQDAELLSSSDYRFDALLGGDAYARLEAWAKQNGHGEQVIDEVYEHLDGSGHKFGGYPFFTQTDPRSGGPLELLLQLNTDDHMMWGDVGVGGFFIDPADLAKGDFSRVMYSWDCY